MPAARGIGAYYKVHGGRSLVCAMGTALYICCVVRTKRRLKLNWWCRKWPRCCVRSKPNRAKCIARARGTTTTSTASQRGAAGRGFLPAAPNERKAEAYRVSWCIGRRNLWIVRRRKLFFYIQIVSEFDGISLEKGEKLICSKTFQVF